MSDVKFSFLYYGETDQGRVRGNNEDTYICQLMWDDRHILCAAIDGLGGYEGGEVAAEIARAVIIRHLEDFASPKIGDLLRDALIEANNEIVSQHKARPKVSQMGCVASVGLIDLQQGIVYIAHVGDSRIYQFMGLELNKLTHDHSLVGYREEIGELSEEDAMHHPKRNVIDRYLGEQHLSMDTEGYIEISAYPIIGDAQFLFCSDGLTDLVTSSQIAEVLSSELSIEDKVKSLIACANEAGGKDNITVVIADVRRKEDDGVVMAGIEEEYPLEKKKKSSISRYFLWTIIGLIIVVVGCCAYYWWGYKYFESDAKQRMIEKKGKGSESNGIMLLLDSTEEIKDDILDDNSVPVSADMLDQKSEEELREMIRRYRSISATDSEDKLDQKSEEELREIIRRYRNITE